jgi:hypothetical protein
MEEDSAFDALDLGLGLAAIAGLAYVVVAGYVLIKLLWCRARGVPCIVGGKEI